MRINLGSEMTDVYFQDKKRCQLLLESRDSSNVTLVCGDGTLAFPSHRLLSMYSPVVRSSNTKELEEMVIILPNFSKSTVSTMLEVIGMKWSGEKSISATENDLLVALGLPTGALGILKKVKESEKPVKQNFAMIEPGGKTKKMLKKNIPTKQNNASFKTQKSTKQKISKSNCQKEQDIVQTKLEKTYSEIKHAMVSAKAKQMDFFMCDLCDDKVERSDLKTHCDEEHIDDIGSPSETEIQSYFRSYSTADLKNTVGSTAENLQDETSSSKIVESIQGGVQEKQPSKGKDPLHTAPPLRNQAKNVRVVTKVKMPVKAHGVNQGKPIAKSSPPQQQTKMVNKEETSGPQKTKTQSVSDRTNKSIQMRAAPNVKGIENMVVKCPKCNVTFGGNKSTVKFDLRSHLGLTHYKNELMVEAETLFVGNKCIQCEKAFDTKDQRHIHLLYNHTHWVELISEETDQAMAKKLEKKFNENRKIVSGEGIQLVSTFKLLSPQAKIGGKEQSVEIKMESLVEEEEKTNKGVRKCVHCETLFLGNDPEEISLHFLKSHTTTNNSYFLSSNQCFVCDVGVIPENQNYHMMKMHDYMKSEIESFILQVLKNRSTSNIMIKDEPVEREATAILLSKVDDKCSESTAAPRKAPDSIADIQRKLLAIVGTQAVQDIDNDPHFEDVVDDEEEDMVADDLGEENVRKETDDKDITGVQADLIEMKNISIKMQNISDDEEEGDGMKDFEDTLEQVLNFKEEVIDKELEEVYRDISDDEYCGEDDEIEREIGLMRDLGETDDDRPEMEENMKL